MRRPLVVVALVAALAACADAPEVPNPAPIYTGPPIPWDYTAFPAVEAPDGDAITAAKVHLGDLLFYDPILSADGKVACATCHSELWGMSDGLAVSVGVGGVGPTGPGRTGPNVTTRNALTIWNVAFRSELFWDGRSPTLEAQALEPLKHPNEMGQPAARGAKRIAGVAKYVDLFTRAFPDDGEPVTAAHVTDALSTFERTLVSGRAPYDHYVGGDAGALGGDEARGMQVFADSNCASCHTPPLFESTRYDKRFASDDEGRFAVTHVEADRGAFRVPTLRNLRDTGPYFHDGSASDLERAVKDELGREIAAGHAKALSAADTAALVSFLYSALEDRTNDPDRPSHVPSGLPVPQDGFRIPR